MPPKKNLELLKNKAESNGQKTQSKQTTLFPTASIAPNMPSTR